MTAQEMLSRFFYRVHRRLAPVYFRADSEDVFLVSYPRSGNTWMRAMIAEMLYGESGSSIRDLQFYVPDIYVKTRAADVINAARHVVKSHSTYQETYQHVIYLVRDPRDVVLSHYRYRVRLGYSDSSLEQFVADWVNGRIWPCSWLEHVNSWTRDNNTLNLDLLLMKYEDLVQDTRGQLNRLAVYLGIDLAQTDMDRIIASASVDKMRLKEKRGMPDHEQARNLDFIGLATSSTWVDRLPSELSDYIASNFCNTMQFHGYEV